MKTARVAYFSGTGGTKLIAEATVDELKTQDYCVDFERIGFDSCYKNTYNKYDLLILISVVHEFNFPQQVRQWVNHLNQFECTKAAVFSVSGGGEVVGNRGAQKEAIEALERQGISVVYDKIFVMPSNYFYRTKSPLDTMLTTVYPIVVKQELEQLLRGQTRRPTIPLFDQLVTRLFRNGWKYHGKFGSAIKVAEVCTACGTCTKICPVGNILMDDKKKQLLFSDACVFCLGCLYACPESALSPGRDKYAVLKEGYDLREIAKRNLEGSEWEQINHLCRGYLYSGIRKYLTEARGLLQQNDVKPGQDRTLNTNNER